MKHIAPTSIFFFVLMILLLGSCTRAEDERAGVTWQKIEKGLQIQLLQANAGDTIRLDEGFFWFTRSVLLEGKENLVIIGAGIDKTVLSFKGQEEGAEGIKISNCRNISLIDLTVEDAKGDDIKVTETNGIYFRRVKASWTGGAKESNGAYGFYPVLCKNVLVEDCVSMGASDAGIYVGQSDTVIIRRNTVFENVAGIESENSKVVDIYENHTYNNTGGILVFDLPGLTQSGRQTRIFNNNIEENNHPNFAPKGNIVGVVPAGTGILILASRDIEIFKNRIVNNRTTSTGIISWKLVLGMGGDEHSANTQASVAGHNEAAKKDTLYDPYPENIWMHDNEMSNKYWMPSIKSDFGMLLAVKRFWRTPDILFDGFVNPKSAKGLRLCLQQKNTFVNIDAANDLKNMSSDITPYQCGATVMTPVILREP